MWVIGISMSLVGNCTICRWPGGWIEGSMPRMCAIGIDMSLVGNGNNCLWPSGWVERLMSWVLINYLRCFLSFFPL